MAVYVCSIVVLCVGFPVKRFLRSTNCTLETDISLMNHYVTWYGICVKISITRAQGRYLHAPKYLSAGAWREAFEMPGKSPDPTGGAYSAPPDPLAGGDRGAGCPYCGFMCWLACHKWFLRSTNCTLETDISMMNHYVT